MAPWVSNIIGEPDRSFEISIVRDDNEHGKRSYGWFQRNRKHVIACNSYANDGGVPMRVFNALTLIAHKEACRLNIEEGLCSSE